MSIKNNQISKIINSENNIRIISTRSGREEINQNFNREINNENIIQGIILINII